jgi:hypothetical protein
MLQVEMELGRPAESSIDSLGKVASKSEQGFVKLDNLLRGRNGRTGSYFIGGGLLEQFWGTTDFWQVDCEYFSSKNLARRVYHGAF